MMHTRRRPSRAITAVAVSFALALTLSLTACDDDVESGQDADEAANAPSNSAAPVDESETAAPDETETSEDEDSGSSTLPADLPEGFPDIGIPFYTPSEQVAGSGDADGMFVLEYVTDHELTIVNMFFRDALAGNGWSEVDRSVEGQMTINKTTGHGYSLVIAVGPERTDDTKTSIHYTVRPE